MGRDCGTDFRPHRLWRAAGNVLRAGRNSFHHMPQRQHRAGQNRRCSLRKSAGGRAAALPWPADRSAGMAGAKLSSSTRCSKNTSDPVDDRLFADAIRRSGRVTFAVRVGPDWSGRGTELGTDRGLWKYAELGSISARYNTRMRFGPPLRCRSRCTSVPSMRPSSPMHGQGGRTFQSIISIDPKTVPSVSAEAVLAGASRTSSLPARHHDRRHHRRDR